MVTPVPKVQMLRHPLPQISALPHVNPQALVQAQDPVDVDGAPLVAQVARQRLQSVQGPAVGEEGPGLWAHERGAEVEELGLAVMLDPGAVFGGVF